MAAPVDPKELAAKQRIISHMNADHQDSLVRYLVHRHQLWSFSARDAYLIDISFTDLTLRASGKEYKVPLQPPLQSWRDARERLVAMDKEALKALDRDPITLKSYRAPRGFHAVVFGAVALTFMAFSHRDNFIPGSPFYDNVGLRYLPAFASFCRTIQPILVPIMLVIHSTEMVVMGTTTLRKHSVPALSGLWWSWTLSCFFEGFCAFQRIDTMVAEQKAEQEKRVH